MSEEQTERLIPPEKSQDEKHKPTTAPLYLGFQDRMNMEFFRTFIQNPQRYQEAPLKELIGSSSERCSSERSVQLDYVYFPLKHVKIQKRENKVSMQRIEDGNVSFALDFQTVENKMAVTGVSVSVKRSNESNYNAKAVGSVPIPNIELSHIQDTKILVKLDLDSVHTYKGKKVYELDRNKEEENMFNLLIEIQYSNGESTQHETRSFKLIGRKGPPVGAKRSYSETNSPSSPDSVLESNMNNVSRAISITSDVDSPDSRTALSVNPSSYDESPGLIEARMVVAEHIKTKFLEVDGQAINLKCITTPNGDIAYHFLLENDDDVFEEGEIVGFVPNEHLDKKLVITKLTFKSASRAVLKGVITRSQYLEAQKPSPGVRSETIAMMGIVPVQVRGSVVPNEPLYASPYHPGFAVSGYQLENWALNEAAFIGYAFSGRKANDSQSAGMVQTAVSVIQSAGQKLLSDRVRQLEDHFEERIVKINKFSRRTRRCVNISVFALLLTLVLLGILLWQLLMPGSALRYYRCAQGRKVPFGDAHYQFIPYKTPDLNATVNGVEFEFDALMTKAGHAYHRQNGTGVRYYLNIDRCAYAYVSKGDILRGIKPVRGPTVFAVDEKCFGAYYYSEPVNRWKQYSSVSWGDRRNICCEPRSKWKTCTQLKSSYCPVKPMCKEDG